MASLSPLSEIEKLIVEPTCDFASVSALCESFELDLCHSDETLPISLTVYKVHLLSYLLTDQISSARFLWKRLGPEIRSDGEIALLWKVGTNMWLKNPAGMQQTLRGATWSHPLVAKLAARLQQENLQASFKSIGAAYNLIPTSVLAERLGEQWRPRGRWG